MDPIASEIIRRFPEVLPRLFGDDEAGPYVVAGLVADWLKGLAPADLTADVVARLYQFLEWCEEQPTGKTAADDPYTVFVVGFFENLFDSPVTRSLIPKFVSKERIVAYAEYYQQWVGEENYKLALEQYQ